MSKQVSVENHGIWNKRFVYTVGIAAALAGLLFGLWLAHHSAGPLGPAYTKPPD